MTEGVESRRAILTGRSWGSGACWCALAGVEVRVEGGALSAGRFRADVVVVRAWHGVPALEGVLVREGDRSLLETADGRRLPIAHLPAAVRGRGGARVWLAGPLDGAPAAFGVIADAAGTRRPALNA